MTNRKIPFWIETEIKLMRRYILNKKRNFRKIGLRGGHTRYERKKKIDTYLK